MNMHVSCFADFVSVVMHTSLTIPLRLGEPVVAVGGLVGKVVGSFTVVLL